MIYLRIDGRIGNQLFMYAFAKNISEKRGNELIVVDDKEAIKSRMTWFLENKLKIYEMGRYARNKAIRYTWEHYEDNVVAARNQVLNL